MLQEKLQPQKINLTNPPIKGRGLPLNSITAVHDYLHNSSQVIWLPKEILLQHEQPLLVNTERFSFVQLLLQLQTFKTFNTFPLRHNQEKPKVLTDRLIFCWPLLTGKMLCFRIQEQNQSLLSQTEEFCPQNCSIDYARENILSELLHFLLVIKHTLKLRLWCQSPMCSVKVEIAVMDSSFNHSMAQCTYAIYKK